MVKRSTSMVPVALLAVILGVTGKSAAVAAATSASTSPTTPKAASTAPKRATTVPAASRKTTEQSAAAETKTRGTKAAVVAKAPTKPVRTAGKPRRATPPAGEPLVAENAPCYERRAGRGRCEPQCLPYTRCRSGISSCRTGHENGPVTWFQCEQARGNTSAEPADGRVLVLGRNAHNMPTGHTLYVEKAEPRDDGRYELTLSHTNYDRRCNLETNMVAEYDPASKTIDVRVGEWEQWGRDLRVAGFIHN